MVHVLCGLEIEATACGRPCPHCNIVVIEKYLVSSEDYAEAQARDEEHGRPSTQRRA